MRLMPKLNCEKLPVENTTCIRLASLGDLDSLILFMRTTWENAYPDQCQEDPKKLDKLFNNELIAKELRDDNIRFFIATNEGKIVGYTKLKLANESSFLDKIYVDPDFQRKGIGKQLLKHGFQSAVASGINTMGLMVEHHNEKAINFYCKYGFAAHTFYRGAMIKDLYPSIGAKLYYGLKMICRDIKSELQLMVDNNATTADKDKKSDNNLHIPQIQ